MERVKELTTRLLSQDIKQPNRLQHLKKFYGRHHDLVNPYNVAVPRIVFANDEPLVDFRNPGHTLLPIFLSFRPMGLVGTACLPSNACHPQLPDYTLYSGVMSVGLNILICHSFTDLRVWIMAGVPWLQLLYGWRVNKTNNQQDKNSQSFYENWYFFLIFFLNVAFDGSQIPFRQEPVNQIRRKTDEVNKLDISKMQLLLLKTIHRRQN